MTTSTLRTYTHPATSNNAEIRDVCTAECPCNRHLPRLGAEGARYVVTNFAQVTFPLHRASGQPTISSGALYGTINSTRKPMREVQLGLKFVF